MMHLEGPWLSTNGKRKGKQKFRNAEEAKRARELEQQWNDLQKKWGNSSSTTTSKKSDTLQISRPLYRGMNSPKIPSLNNGVDSAVAAKRESKVYTGTLIKGVSQMHKSNSVPVIDEQQILEIARMRR